MAIAKYDYEEGWVSCEGCGFGWMTLNPSGDIKYCMHCGAKLEVECGCWIEKQGAVDEFDWIPERIRRNAYCREEEG